MSKKRVISGVSIFNIPGLWQRGKDLPVGTERMSIANGCLMEKVSMRRIKDGVKFSHYNGTWKLKHHLIWEKHYGRVPKGYNVIFLDRNKFNFDIDNLALATKLETALLYHYGLYFNDKERTRTGLAIVKQRAAIGRLMKQTHNTYNLPKINLIK